VGQKTKFYPCINLPWVCQNISICKDLEENPEKRGKSSFDDMQSKFHIQIPKGALQAQTAPTEWQFHEFYCDVCTEHDLEDLMDDPKMPELAEDVDLDDDSEDGDSEYGSGDEGDMLQDFIERSDQDFPFPRTEGHPRTDSRPTGNQPEGFTDTTRGPDSSRETRELGHNSTGPNIEEI
jgi:hypothetical protein